VHAHSSSTLEFPFPPGFALPPTRLASTSRPSKAATTKRPSSSSSFSTSAVCALPSPHLQTRTHTLAHISAHYPLTAAHAISLSQLLSHPFGHLPELSC